MSVCYPLSTKHPFNVACAVTNLRVVNTTTNSATITWDQPPHNYRVFLHGEATDNIPQSRVINETNVTGQTTHVVQGLNSFRNYSIGVYLKSNLGQGSNATVTFQTLRRGKSAESAMSLSACVHISCACEVCYSELKQGSAQCYQTSDAQYDHSNSRIVIMFCLLPWFN